MLIVYWLITKFRIRKQPQNHKLILLPLLFAVKLSCALLAYFLQHNNIIFHKYFWCSRFCEIHSNGYSVDGPFK